MEFNDSIELTKIAMLVLLLLICSATDLSARRVPNAILLPALMTALFLNSVDEGLAGLADSVAGLAIGLLMLMPLGIIGRMGAGDIKLLGVVGSILGAWGALVAGLATMMAGGILACLYLAWLFIKPGVVSRVSRIAMRDTDTAATRDDGTSWQTVRATEIPYGVAVATGTFAALIYLDLLTGVSIT